MVPVVEGDDVESDGLRHGEDDRQHPNGHDLHHCQQGDAHPLNSAPGRHSSVPGAQKHSVTVTESAPAAFFSFLHGSTPNPTNGSVSNADQNVKN